jgi:single-stranded DNA-specific DHH superfamily exonuclease
MSQYVDPYDTPKPMPPPPAYPGSSNNNNGYSQPPNVVVMQETNIDVTVVHHAQQQTKPQPTTHVTQVNQNNYNRAGGDDCGLGFCCGCCTALLLCSVM